MKKQIRNSLLRDGNSKTDEGQRRRMCLIDDWMEKKRIHTRPVPPLESSSASSSHSSSPVFSSSGSESLRPTKNKDSCFPPRQIRTTVRSSISKLDHSSLSLERMKFDDYSYCSVSANQETGPKPESRAPNKPKLLPISPGAKLTSFINSMFTGRRERKATNPSSAADTCSSASSFTRSCLANKSPSSSTDRKPAKKSVRFYPLSVEDSVDILYRNVEHSGISSISRRDENLTLSVVEEGDIDDAASDASSDLFEIDHIIFAAINSNSVGTHEDELPVFETTSVTGSNRAISNGGVVF
uniref:Uncharacterized protein n=1 Tax=Kalanchoe fedtschenkoi TaxID=63787 RepID=A0A7N0VBJ9_KALFE